MLHDLPSSPGRLSRRRSTIPIDGAALRSRRTTARLSTRALGRQVGVTHVYIVRLENGTSLGVSPTVFARLQKALAVDSLALIAATAPKVPAV